MADALITRLSNIRSLTIRPTSSIAQLDNSKSDSIELGRRLQVDAVMEGTLLESGGRLRATMRLLNISDGRTIWSGEYENAATDEIGFEKAISTKTADALAVNLNSDERSAIAKLYTTNEDAYQLYLEGRLEWSKRSSGMQSRRDTIDYSKFIRRERSLILSRA
jgi:hypothetical protein